MKPFNMTLTGSVKDLTKIWEFGIYSSTYHFYIQGYPHHLTEGDKVITHTFAVFPWTKYVVPYSVSLVELHEHIDEDLARQVNQQILLATL